MSKKTHRPMRALILAGILSIAAGSAVQAGGKVTGSDFHSDAKAAINGADWPPPPSGHATSRPLRGGGLATRSSRHSSHGRNGGHVHNAGGRVTGSEF